MPLIGSGGALGTPVTSTDGYLTVTPDGTTASDLIDVNFHGVTGGTPDRVTVTRTVNGVTSNVRGLDCYTSPGAVTRGIDHCVPLGATVTYQATAANSLTGATWTSGTVAVPSPAPSVPYGWIKSPLRPALSVALVVQAWPDWTYTQPQGVFLPLGAQYPTVSQGERSAGTGSVVLGTNTADDVAALRELLQFGGPLLLQAEAAVAPMRPDVYVQAGDLSMTAPNQDLTWRDWSFTVVEIDVPPTAGVSVPLPGHTFGDSKIRKPLYSDRSGTYQSRMTA